MKLFVKLFGIAMLLAALVLAGFIIWGTEVETIAADYQSYMEGAKPWAWIGAIGLFISDLVLPVPGTVLLSGLGAVYGIVIGGLIGLTGYFLSAMLAYVLARQFGKDLVLKIASEDEVNQAHDCFNRWGGLAVVLSRSMPIFPEVISLMAGLLKMKLSRFIFAVLLGSAPISFFFAWVGAMAVEEPRWALALTLILPALIWCVSYLFLKRVKKPLQK